jgi:hypothetical protein
VPTDRLRLPGARDLRASLDAADGADADAVVVACPPHPQHGGRRHDPRLTAVSDALPARIDCLRVDYGPWDDGRGERADARTARDWAADRYDRVGLFGYSFGGGVAVLTASETHVDATAALAPVARLDDGSDAVAAVPAVAGALWVCVGTADDVVDADRVADAVRDHGGTVETVEAGHAVAGRERTVARRVAAFFEATL